MEVTFIHKSTFTVKELADGTPFVLMEPEVELSDLKGRLLRIHLRDGATIEDAEALARDLRERVRGLSVA